MKKLNEGHAESILLDMGDVSAQKIRQLMSYPENTAGGLMITEYLSYTDQHRIKDFLDDLRQHGEQYSDYEIQYAYVVTDTRKLVGVLRLRDLLMAPKHQPIHEVMVRNPLSVNVHTSLRELREFFRQNTFLGVPVVDDTGNLVGVIRSSTVREAANRQNNQLFRNLPVSLAAKSSGACHYSSDLLADCHGSASILFLTSLLRVLSSFIRTHWKKPLSGSISADYIRHERLLRQPGRCGEYPGIDAGAGATPGIGSHTGQRIYYRYHQRPLTGNFTWRRGASVERKSLPRVGGGGFTGCRHTGSCEFRRTGSVDSKRHAHRSRPGFRAATNNHNGHVRVFLCVKFCFDTFAQIRGIV
jgi:CBS domain-containing protein